MVKFINIALAVLATIFVALVTGSLVAGSIYFGFALPVVVMLSCCFVLVTAGVGAVSLMEAIHD